MGQPLTAIRSNSMPQGGVTSLQSVAPEQVPAQIAQLIQELTPAITRFRMNSSPQNVPLDVATFKNAGDSKAVRISSVGLGWRIRSKHVANFLISNTAAAAQTVKLSKWFPYNLLQNTNVSINGGSAVYSASGPSGLLVAGRKVRNFFNPVNYGMNPAFCRVSFGAGLTPTASSSFTASGYDSFSIAATTNNAVLTVEFYTIEKLAYSEDTMLGALPLQNNSVFAQLTRTLIGSFTGTTDANPFYVAGGFPATTTVALDSNGLNTSADYDFWSVPADPGLYADMVNQSYQVQEQPNIPQATTGSRALVYEFPTNQFLIAAHLIGRDNNGAPWAWNALPNLNIEYNAGSITPIKMEVGKTRLRQYLTYGADLGAIPGYRLWDGDDTADSLYQTDEAGWIDTYHAASPRLVADVDNTIVTAMPSTFSVTREILVAGSVQTVG